MSPCTQRAHMCTFTSVEIEAKRFFAENVDHTVLKLQFASFLRNEAVITTFATVSSISGKYLHHCNNNELRLLLRDIMCLHVIN